ncbi:MAG: DUF559 domain-containing protein [Mycobacterium sp.]|nr:MAG: DUF559 domain-containing protein [Mycobacterium sp.]
MTSLLWRDTLPPCANRSSAARQWQLIHDNRHRPAGLQIRGDRLRPDEIQTIGGVAVTTPPRTALDLTCWYPTVTAVAGVDALARACELKMADVEVLIQRYQGRRGIRRARESLDLIDAGAQSPKESWLRVILMQAGLPRPQTQIPVCDGFGAVRFYLDMGWEDTRVAVEYDGDQHRSDRSQHAWDVKRLEMLQRLGWIVIRVLAGDHPAEVVHRVRSALTRRA